MNASPCDFSNWEWIATVERNNDKSCNSSWCRLTNILDNISKDSGFSAIFEHTSVSIQYKKYITEYFKMQNDHEILKLAVISMIDK